MTSDAKLRVAIARDAIALIKSDRATAVRGSFVRVGPDAVVATAQKSIKATVEHAIENEDCKVCALGSLFVAAVLKVKKVGEEEAQDVLNNNYDEVRTETLFRSLKEIFPIETLEKIEIAFEKGGGWFQDRGYGGVEHHFSKECFNAYANSYSDIYSTRERLVAIMQNIVENEGEFVVPKGAP